MFLFIYMYTKTFAWSKIYVPNLARTLAMFIGIAIWVTSTPYFRRKKFEIFLYTHQRYGLYIIFYVFHVGDSWLCMILPNIVLFFIDRYLRFPQSTKRSMLLNARLLPSDNIELTYSKVRSCHTTYHLESIHSILSPVYNSMKIN